MSSMFPLALVLLPAADLLMDRAPEIFLTPYHDSRVFKMRRHDDGKGLSEAERGMFMVGLFFTSMVVYSSKPTSISRDHMEDVALLFESFSNVSTILTISPLISFLTRRATSIHPIVVALIAVLVNIGSFLNALSYCFDPTSALAANLVKAAGGLILGAGALYVLLCLWCLVGNALWERAVRAGPQAMGSTSATSDTLHSAAAIKDARFDRLVVGVHMASILGDFAVQCIWYNAQPVTSANMATFVYATSCSCALVLFTELRVRKFEVLRGSLALLDAKKSYVRYIRCAVLPPSGRGYI